MDTRIVEVDKEFYAKLAEYLQPEERFTPPINLSEPNGLVLHVIYIGRKLIFTPTSKIPASNKEKGEVS